MPSLPISAKRRVDFTPSWREEEDPKPVYHLKVPTVETRAEFRVALSDRGAFYTSRAQLCAMGRKALQELAEDRSDLFELLARAAEVPDLEPLPDQDAQALSELEEVLVEHWPDYARAVGGNRRWSEFMPVLAARMFLAGWTNGPDGCNRIVLRDEDRMAIPQGDLVAIGWKAVSLMGVSEAQAKNSVAPSP